MNRPGSRRKTTSARKPRKGSRSLPTGVLALLAGAAVLVISGIGLLKWAETRPGQAALLTMGSEKMYGEVQTAVEQALQVVLPGLPLGQGPVFQEGVVAEGRDGDWAAPQLGQDAAIRCRKVALTGEETFWAVQVRIQEALQGIGAQILWGERMFPERPGPKQVQPNDALDLLRLDVGVPGRPTHTLVLHHGKREPRLVWGAGRGRSTWDQFAADPAPTLALVIDDWGNNTLPGAMNILALDVPLTMAVLPGLPFSRRFALEKTDLVLPPDHGLPRSAAGPAADARVQRLQSGCPVEVVLGSRPKPIRKKRREVILHLPMEPEGFPDPDPGDQALMVGMDESGIADLLDGARQALPMVTGVNNHMGSAATADRPTMAALMNVLAARGLFFLDSKTTPASVANDEAQKAGVPTLSNRMFLDYDNEDPERIRANLRRLAAAARATGFAVGIGHPHPATADVLGRELPRLVAEGFRFVTVSEMMELKAARESAEAGGGR